MITLNEFAAQIAEISGCTAADAENFIRELVSVIAEQLEEIGEAEVPALGRFAIVEGELKFNPTDELAAVINAPFADFEPMPLPPGYIPESAEEQEPITEEEIPEEQPIETTSEEEPTPETLPEPELIANESEKETVEQCNTDKDEVCIKAVEKSQARTWPWWLAACVGTFFLGYWLGGVNLNISDILARGESPTEAIADTTQTIEAPIEEPIEIVEEPAPQVFDTISSTRYLTTMARRHYGQMDYWVYIYEANADKLGHPDMLDAGVVVRIPPADSLGLVAGDKQKIAEAQSLAAQIYSRF